VRSWHTVIGIIDDVGIEPVAVTEPFPGEQETAEVQVR
jgi:hypothetical protein